jgi:hypothetical protein
VERAEARQIGTVFAVVVIACLCGALLLGGCAATQTEVRRMATGTAAAAYELRGKSLAALQQQAQALCAPGYIVVRQWERTRSADANAGMAGRWWATASDWTDPPGADAAQMTVQCKG